MKKVVGFLRNLRFGFSEVDADLNGLEFLGAIVLGVAICATPFVIKAILLAVHFGGAL